MDLVALDGTCLLILDGIIGQKSTNVLIQGIVAFDGESLRVRSLHDDNEVMTIPESKWDLVEIPVTGKWRKKYPQAECYVIYNK